MPPTATIDNDKDMTIHWRVLGHILLYLDHGVCEIHLQLSDIGSGFTERGEADIEAVNLPLHLCPLLVKQELVEADQLQVGFGGHVVVPTLGLVVVCRRLWTSNNARQTTRPSVRKT